VSGRTLGFGVLEEVLLLESLLDLGTKPDALARQNFGAVAVRTCSAIVLILRTGCTRCLLPEILAGICRITTVQLVRTPLPFDSTATRY